MNDSKKLDNMLEMVKAKAEDGFIAMRILPRREGKREFLKHYINKALDEMSYEEIDIIVEALIK